MGNIAPRWGIKPIYLAFWASGLTIRPLRLPDVTTLSTATCLGSSLHEKSLQTPILSYVHDLSGKQPHRQVGMVRMVASGTLERLEY